MLPQAKAYQSNLTCAARPLSEASSRAHCRAWCRTSGAFKRKCVLRRDAGRMPHVGQSASSWSDDSAATKTHAPAQQHAWQHHASSTKVVHQRSQTPLLSPSVLLPVLPPPDRLLKARRRLLQLPQDGNLERVAPLPAQGGRVGSRALSASPRH